ncbi:hypothetical protein PAL_GLEAN10012740 [Pteropus alecto]|uniref:Uncharacterized protein n=1 Tax=Pteropus alecto TaxID=9402 RepID=L5K6V6_PTEAL|nr:hypothetical protein PAL_GLEAN10012740 [Pteropus alecto]
MQEFPAPLKMHVSPLQGPSQICTRNLKELWLERRPPIVTDLDVPGPTKYEVLEASVRESSPHPHFSIGRKPPTRARNPGPAAYYVEDCYNSRFPSAPGVVIQGVRRPKRHDTGPFCTL